MGTSHYFVEFDYDKMVILKNAKTYLIPSNLQKVNDETFLASFDPKFIGLINKKDLSCLSQLKLEVNWIN